MNFYMIITIILLIEVLKYMRTIYVVEIFDII